MVHDSMFAVLNHGAMIFYLESKHCTVKNTVISPNFLVWRFCGKAQFSHSFGRYRPKLCGNCAFPQNFHTRKLG